MLAKLVQADMDPLRIDDAADAVEHELIPSFVAHPGARHGYWMANRTSGQVLVMTCWADADSLEAARAADGKERARVAERIGIRIRAIQTLDVLGFDESNTSEDPVLQFARATWVEGLSSDLDLSLRAMHSEIVPSQSKSPGFSANYWLADYGTGNGLGLSFWSSLEELRNNDGDGESRRKWFEQKVGCKIDMVGEYEALAVVAASVVDVTDVVDLTESSLSTG